MKTVLLSKFRIVSIVSAMVLFVACICSFNSMPANSVNTVREYQTFNAKTGEYIDSYSLTVEHGEQPSPRVVIGNDERYVDWSKSGVVKIIGYEENSTKRIALGTGFVVGKHAIATAAHVVTKYNTGGVITPIKFHGVKLFNADGTVAQTLISSNESTNMTYHVPVPYLNGGSSLYDYAVITVSEDLSKYQSFDLGYVTDDLITSGSANVFVTGFPLELGGENVNTFSSNNMYTAVGTLLRPTEIRYDATNDLIYYTVDTSAGNSGSPVYIKEDVRGQTFYTVIGIHRNGYNDTDIGYNFGVRFDSDILKFYKGNPNIQ